jgi:hypothetical protein
MVALSGASLCREEVNGIQNIFFEHQEHIIEEWSDVACLGSLGTEMKEFILG